MAAKKQIIFAPFRLDFADERLFRGDDEVHLHPKAFSVLKCLTEHSGTLVTKYNLIETVWPGLHVSDAVLTVSIRELRKALGDDPKKPKFIETVHRRGYRFIAAIELPSQPTQEESPAQPAPCLSADDEPSAAIVSEVASTIGALPLVGRENELAFLLERLDATLRGEGSVVFITGEAGIGKTRLAMEVRRHAQQKGCQWLAGKYDKAVSEPYKAWADILRSSIRGESSLRSLANSHAEQLAKIVPEIGKQEKTAATVSKDPDTERRRLLEGLTDFLVQVSHRAPLVLFLDDLQWAASIEPVQHLSQKIGNRPILILAAYRDDELRENSITWSTVLEMNRQRLFYPLPLKPLDQQEVAKLMSQRIEGMPDSHLVELLYRKTQGNPFFLEEMVRLLQQRDAIVQADGGWRLEEPALLEIPDSVKAVVHDHVERFGKDAADLVEVASVCGREFPLRVLTELAGQEEAAVVQILDRFEAGGLVQSLPLQAEERYRFSHDLWQESLYESVGPAQRRRFHLAIGRAIEKLYADDLPGHHDALAHHFSEGNHLEKTIKYSELAAGSAVSVHAHGRAVAHLQRALAALAELPTSEETLKKAIDIRVKLGTSLSSVKGYGATEVKENYTQARELCRELGETPQLFPVLWGLSLSNRAQRSLQESKQLGEQLLSLAARSQDPELLLEAHHTLWATLFQIGEFVPARAHLEQADALFASQRHRHHAFLYGGHDPEVCCRQHAARTLLLLGHPDRALQQSKDAVSLARELSHPFSLGHALFSAAWVCQHRGDWQTAQERAEDMLKLGIDEKLSRWVARGTVFKGRVLAETGLEEGSTLMQQSLLSALSGEPLQRDFFSALLAEAYLKLGQIEQGLNEVREALERVRKSGPYYYEPELHRLKGELLLRSDGERLESKVQEVEACFQEAIKISRRQEAKSLELRAVMSLSRLWRHQGKQEEAQRMLAEIYGWFTEGFDTRDLQEAKALLNELS